MSMTVDQTETLKARFTRRNSLWASSDETVAAVDENGCVTAVGEGMGRDHGDGLHRRKDMV